MISFVFFMSFILATQGGKHNTCLFHDLTARHIQCGPSMMDSVDLYPSKPAIDITIDILFYSMMSMIDITLMMADRYPFYYMM